MYRVLALIDIILYISDIKNLSWVLKIANQGRSALVLSWQWRNFNQPYSPSSSQQLPNSHVLPGRGVSASPVFRTEFLPLNTAELLIIWNSHRECHQSKFNAYLLQNVDAPSRSNEYAKVFSADERRLPRKYREF